MIKKLLMVPLIAVAFFTLTGFDMKDTPEWESDEYGGDIEGISATDEAIYIVGRTTETVQAINPTDGSIIWESPNYGGAIEAISATSEAIYIGGRTTETVQAINPTDGSIIWESPNYGGTIDAISATSEAIYIGGSTTQTVQAINPTDGSIVWESPDYGGSINAISATDDAMYVGGTTNTLQAYEMIDPPTFIETVFGVLSGIIIGGISVLTALFANSAILSIFYTQATETVSGSLTMVGAITLLTVGFTLTLFGFRFVLNMIKKGG